MTVKLIVLCTQPDDPDAFEEHYQGIHKPLVEKIPGLQHWDSARIVAAPDGGEQAYHRIVELYFDNHAALQAALESAEGQATANDFQTIAPPGSRLLAATVDS